MNVQLGDFFVKQKITSRLTQKVILLLLFRSLCQTSRFCSVTRLKFFE